MTAEARLTPIPDERSAAFWKAASDHVLSVARCGVCGMLAHPPDTVCPHCGSTDPEFAFTPVSGRGTVRSWTVVRRAFLAGFDVPFLLVDVELVEQADLRLIGRLVDGPDTVLQVGNAVRTVFEDIAPGVAVPAFTLEGRP
jgi:uncharacterized OB-fold protein